MTEELDDGAQVEVRDAFVVWQFCPLCARCLDLEHLPRPQELVEASVSREARDELALELDDF